MRLVSIAEIYSRPDSRRRTQWGNWRLNRKHYTLDIQVPNSSLKNVYPVSLKGATAASVLRQLAHMAEKSWITSDDLGDLVHALHDLLGFYALTAPRGALCLTQMPRCTRSADAAQRGLK